MKNWQNLLALSIIGAIALAAALGFIPKDAALVGNIVTGLFALLNAQGSAGQASPASKSADAPTPSEPKQPGA